MKRNIFRFCFLGFILLIVVASLVSSNSRNIITRVNIDRESFDLNMNTSDLDDWKLFPLEVISTESANESTYPSLGVDSAGNIHIVWVDEVDYAGSGTDKDIFYKYFNRTTSSWSTLELITNESATHSSTPSLAVDSEVNLHVAYQEAADIYYRRFNRTTHLWTIPELVSSESTAFPSLPSIGIDSVGNIHIAWEDNSDYNGADTDTDIFYKRYDVGSGSWTTTEVVSVESTGNSISPSLAIDHSDNIHLAWGDWTDYAGAGADQDIFYKYYNIGTSAWTTVEVISTESTIDSMRPSLGIDSIGNLHIAWQDGTNYNNADNDWDIFYKMYKQSTKSWSTIEVVSTESSEESQFPSLAVDRENNIHIAWLDRTDYHWSDTDNDIFYKTFQHTTSTWTNAEVLSPESTYGSYSPCLAVDNEGTVHVAWEDNSDYNGAGNDVDIFFRIFAEPLLELELAPIVPDHTYTGSIELEWKPLAKATHYYIYRNDTIIWTTKGLTPIAEVTTNSYIDNLPDYGKFYYAIVAGNYLFNSSVSNSVSVVYSSESSEPSFFLRSLDLRWIDFIIIIAALIGLQILLFVLAKRK